MMADKTGIQWTDATWNPLRGCARVSEGCRNCYAERQAHRMNHPGGAYEGLTVVGANGRPRWSGAVRLVPELLDQPLRWTKPRLVFVNSMSDLFHPDVPFEFIAAVFGVMAACPQHIFQVLTKRPERALEWFRWEGGRNEVKRACAITAGSWVRAHYLNRGEDAPASVQGAIYRAEYGPWPLPNVWLGVSAEDQDAADKRIPLLLQCPAAVRWVSAEPLLGPLDLRNGVEGRWSVATARDVDGVPVEWTNPGVGYVPLDWVVVGGESGPGARPCSVEWIRSVVQDCEAAGVPVFVKQLGAEPRGQLWIKTDGKGVMFDHRITGVVPVLGHPKGGDPSEWPPDLVVRQMPAGFTR